MSEPIKGLLIDPTKRTVEEVLLASKPGDPDKCHGTQVLYGEYKRLLGDVEMDHTYLGAVANVALGVPVVDDEGGPMDFWQWPGCDPVPGLTLLHGHRIMEDACFDCPISLEDARAQVTFTKRIIRGYQTTETKGEGQFGEEMKLRVERVAPIVEER